MSDEQEQAERLDGDVLGDDPAVDRDEYPDLDQEGDLGPMNSEDPNVLAGGDLDAPDDERTRVWREEPDIAEEPPQEPGVALIDDHVLGDEPTADFEDVESELTGDLGDPDDAELSPEEAAVHIEPEP